MIFALLPLLAAVVTAETAARLLAPEAPYATSSGFVEPDDELIWRLAPHRRGFLATNELGLRDTAYRADAELKVLLLGDSVAWGDGLREVREGFPYRLERALEAMSDKTVEIVNAGVPGYSTFQQNAYLARNLARLSPAVVVLQFCLNDVTERYTALAEYGGGDFFLGVDTRTALRGLRGTLLRNSYVARSLLRLAQNRGRGREAYRVRNLTRSPLAPELVDAWATALAELDRWAAALRAENLPALLVVAPFRFQLDDPQGLRQPQDVLLEWSRRNGVEVVDLLPVFAASGHTPQGLFHDDTHFSALGHAVAARAILSPLARAGGLAQAVTR